MTNCILLLFVFKIEIGSTGEGKEERESRLFPDQGHKDAKITCFALTPEFFIYATQVKLMM